MSNAFVRCCVMVDVTSLRANPMNVIFGVALWLLVTFPPRFGPNVMSESTWTDVWGRARNTRETWVLET